MDKVDRGQSVFGVQKADVQRLLGVEDRPKRPSWLWRIGYGEEPTVTQVNQATSYIEHLEQASVDALAVLDNMEEETWTRR